MSAAPVTSIVPLPNDSYFDYIKARIRQATKRIWIHMFIVDCRAYEDPQMQVRDLVKRLARTKGLDVRVILGDSATTPGIHFASRVTALYASLLGIPVRIFRSATYGSTHCKYVIIDDEESVIGSHNWEAGGFSIFYEDSVAVRSQSVTEDLQQEFDSVWNSSTPVELEDEADSAKIKQTILSHFDDTHEKGEQSGTPAIVLSDGQSRASLLLSGAYPQCVSELLAKASQRVRITMFYASFSDNPKADTRKLMTCLSEINKRGVDVKIILDKDAVGQFYGSRIINQKAFEFFKKNKVNVRFDEVDRVTHSKVVVVDDRYVVVGSHNWTVSSFTKYSEASVYIESSSLAQFYCQQFEDRWNLGH